MNTQDIAAIAFSATRVALQKTDRKTARASATAVAYGGRTASAFADAADFRDTLRTAPLIDGMETSALSNGAADPVNRFVQLVKDRENEKKISFGQALREVSRENPVAAAAYMKAMTDKKPVLPLENHPFVAQARSIARAKGVSESQAQAHLARVNYPLYQQYLASLGHAAKQSTAAAAGTGRAEFLKLVRTAQARGVSLDEAVNFVSSSRPDLAAAYRQSFRRNTATAR
jgi:hypothetical protein